MKLLEDRLLKGVDEAEFGSRLFGNSLADPQFHESITMVGKSIIGRESSLPKVVERLGHMALDTSDAVNILLPKLPNVAKFVRGVSFFAFEDAFQQHGEV